MDIKEFIKSKENKRRTIGKQMIENPRRVYQIIKENPELAIGCTRLEQDCLTLERLAAMDRPIILEGEVIPNPWGRLDITMPDLSDKKKHFWFYSHDANYGKTHMAKYLVANLRADYW